MDLAVLGQGRDLVRVLVLDVAVVLLVRPSADSYCDPDDCGQDMRWFIEGGEKISEGQGGTRC